MRRKLFLRFIRHRSVVMDDLKCDKEFQKELAFLRKSSQLELPVNYVKSTWSKGSYEKVVCNGFTITNTFPNNIAITKNPAHRLDRAVIWVTKIETSDVNKQDVILHGYKFLNIDDMLKEPVPSHLYGSLLVGHPSKNPSAIKIRDVIAKGMPLHTDALSRVGEPLRSERTWVIDVIDHQSV